MKAIKPVTRLQAKRMMQEIYIDNVIKFLENKYKNPASCITDDKKYILARKWLKNSQLQEILKTAQNKLSKFFEEVLQGDEESVNNLIQAYTDEAHKERLMNNSNNIITPSKDTNYNIKDASDEKPPNTADPIQSRNRKKWTDNSKNNSIVIHTLTYDKCERGVDKSIESSGKNESKNTKFTFDVKNTLIRDNSATSITKVMNMQATTYKPKARRGQNAITLAENLQNCSQKLYNMDSFIQAWKSDLDTKNRDELDQTGFTPTDFDKVLNRKERVEEILYEIANKETHKDYQFHALRSEIWEIVEEYEHALSEQSLTYKKELNLFKLGTENRILELEKQNSTLTEKVERLSNHEELDQKYREAKSKLNDIETAMSSMEKKFKELTAQTELFKKVFLHIEANFVGLKKMIALMKKNKDSNKIDHDRVEVYQKNALKCYDYVERLFWDDDICRALGMKIDSQTHPMAPPTLELLDIAMEALMFKDPGQKKEYYVSKQKPTNITGTQASMEDFDLMKETDLNFYKNILRKAYEIITKKTFKDESFNSLKKIVDIQKFNVSYSEAQILSAIEIKFGRRNTYPNTVTIGEVALDMLQKYEGLIENKDYILEMIDFAKKQKTSSKLDHIAQPASTSTENLKEINKRQTPATLQQILTEKIIDHVDAKSLLVLGIMRIMSQKWLKQEMINPLTVRKVGGSKPIKKNKPPIEPKPDLLAAPQVIISSELKPPHSSHNSQKNTPNHQPDSLTKASSRQQSRHENTPKIKSRQSVRTGSQFLSNDTNDSSQASHLLSQAIQQVQELSNNNAILTEQNSFTTGRNTNLQIPSYADIPDDNEVSQALTPVGEKSEIISQKTQNVLFIDRYVQTEIDQVFQNPTGYIYGISSDFYGGVGEEDGSSAAIKRFNHWKNILPEEIFSGEMNYNGCASPSKVNSISPLQVGNDLIVSPATFYLKDQNAKLNKLVFEKMKSDKNKLPKLEKYPNNSLMGDAMPKSSTMLANSEYLDIKNKTKTDGLLTHTSIKKVDKTKSNKNERTLEDIIYEQTKKTILALNEYLELNQSPSLKNSSSNTYDIEETAKAIESLLKQKLLDNKYNELLEYLRKKDKSYSLNENQEKNARALSQGKTEILKKAINSGQGWKVNYTPGHTSPNSKNSQRLKTEEGSQSMRNNIQILRDVPNPLSCQTPEEVIESPNFKPYKEILNPLDTPEYYTSGQNRKISIKMINIQENMGSENWSNMYGESVLAALNKEGPYISTTTKSHKQPIMTLNLQDIRLPIDPLTDKSPEGPELNRGSSSIYEKKKTESLFEEDEDLSIPHRYDSNIPLNNKESNENANLMRDMGFVTLPKHLLEKLNQIPSMSRKDLPLNTPGQEKKIAFKDIVMKEMSKINKKVPVDKKSIKLNQTYM